MDEYCNISLPTDIGTTAMTEWELCNLFGITAPTLRAGVKALCKSGVLREYEIRQTIRISDKSSMDVYNLETITSLAFHIGTYGAERVRQTLLDRIMHGRKEKLPFSFRCSRRVNPTAAGKRDEYQQASISSCNHINKQTC